MWIGVDCAEAGGAVPDAGLRSDRGGHFPRAGRGRFAALRLAAQRRGGAPGTPVAAPLLFLLRRRRRRQVRTPNRTPSAMETTRKTRSQPSPT